MAVRLAVVTDCVKEETTSAKLIRSSPNKFARNAASAASANVQLDLEQWMPSSICEATGGGRSLSDQRPWTHAGHSAAVGSLAVPPTYVCQDLGHGGRRVVLCKPSTCRRAGARGEAAARSERVECIGPEAEGTVHRHQVRSDARRGEAGCAMCCLAQGVEQCWARQQQPQPETRAGRGIAGRARAALK